jgi:predicted phage terminase large subunit-like protein
MSEACLTPEDRAILEEYAVRTARTNFSQYCELTYRGLWQPTKYTDLICEKLEKVERGEIRKLILTLPPQHGKSMCVTETFPSWFIGKDPTRNVIEVSYSDEYARKFGGSNRKKVKDFGKRLFGIEVDPRRGSDTYWQVDGHRGGMISAGVLGGITGAGADLLLLDDPIKNFEEANSAVYREKIWNEWQSTFRTRVHAEGVIIVILTRWHEDDLIGRILDSPEADEWTVIRLPAEAEENDPLGRVMGDPLWPENGYDRTWMASQKVAVGPYVWTSLYQGRPTPASGEIIQRGWWKFYDELPGKYDELTQDWDLALKGGPNSSRVCGQIWMTAGANSYLVDMVCDIMDFPTTLDAMRTLSGKHPEAGSKYVEDKANGPAAIAILKNEIPGLIEVPPHGDKITRAKAVTGFIQAGNVFLPNPKIFPEKAAWVHDFIQECSSFPRGRYNDRVDVMSQHLSRRLMKRPKKNRFFHTGGSRR